MRGVWGGGGFEVFDKLRLSSFAPFRFCQKINPNKICSQAPSALASAPVFAGSNEVAVGRGVGFWGKFLICFVWVFAVWAFDFIWDGRSSLQH